MNAVDELAESQQGLLTHTQLLGRSVSEEMIEYRLRTGRWERVTEGVYRIAGSQRTWEQSLMALTLSAGSLSAASHRSAAALLGIPGFARGGLPEATAPRPRRHRRSDAIIHRSRVLPGNHLTVVDGIPTTRVARTLVDLAAVLHPARVERAVDNCLARGAVTLPLLVAVTKDLGARGRTGIGLMRELLDARGAGYVAPESELEARFLDLVTAAGLPTPRLQLPTGDHQEVVGRVDCAYPQAKLLVELDSRRHHTARLDWESDRARDNRLVAAGWRVLRFTWDDVTRRPGQVTTALSTVLSASGHADPRLSRVSVPRTA